MKHFLRSTLSLLLTLALSAGLAVSAAASEALGEDLTSQDTAVNRSAVLSTNVFWSTTYSDLRTENLITYTPNAAVTPMVTYGSVLTSCNTISAAAKELESEGYRVVAGLNGDFYNTSTGLPIGLVVANGKLRSTDGGYYAIGFKSDGSAVLGRPTVKITADLGYMGYDADGYGTQVIRSLTGVNKARVSTGGIYLYTYDFNSRHTTGNTEPGVDVVCSIESGSLTIGGTVTLRVEQVLEASSATAIGPNQVVLSVNSQSNSFFVNALKNEAAGNTVTLNISASSSEWNDVQYAVGALYSLVQNGSVASGLPSGTNPRTAVGQRADGTLIFYTIDGRQAGYSIGTTMTQLAQRLIELGCTTALCLDGGGSTTLTVTKPDATLAKTVNSPSGGSERAVSNQIFLVATSQPTGELDHFYVSADSSYVLAGSKVNLTASAVDTNFIPMSGQSYTLSSSDGSLSGNVLTTPAAGGDITVTASGGGASGSAVVHAVKSVDSIAVKNGSTTVTSLTMTPGSSLSLTAAAVHNHLALKADAGAFTWKLTGGIGSVDASGRITASAPGTGTLTVSAGGKSASVQITVSTVALKTLEDFESGAPDIAGYSYGAALTANSDPNFVRLGRMSGKLAYKLGSDGTASLVFDSPYAAGSAYTLLNLWVYGDNSGNALTLLTSDGTNTSSTQLSKLDFSGWKQFSVALPAGTTSVSGFRITGTASVTEDPETGNITVSYPADAGTLYFDQLTASYNGTVDTAAPAVTASVSETTLTASVKDAVDGILPKSGVAVMADGKPIAFTYDAKTGAVSAALSLAAGAGHRITVLAKDASGNIGRASADIDSYSVDHQFTDVKNYWGAAYVDFMKTAGITTGYADGTFRPNDSITRQQFAVMLFRYLGLDSAKYESLTMPFADSGKIASYAQTAVRALYSIGIIGGTEKGGKLYFNPDASLTRAQAAAMIGRTQEKGYASAELSFTDAGAVPAYAAPYIQTMAAQGVIGGYSDGTFRPAAVITRGQMAKILYNLL
ncbi:MAG: S-layer homology domain-containing protein [Oscillibacter sp.]|jgi:hypothetical protein|nr:S-layer homology domain-containing protein [Oscillibacter sp.]